MSGTAAHRWNPLRWARNQRGDGRTAPSFRVAEAVPRQPNSTVVHHLMLHQDLQPLRQQVRHLTLCQPVHVATTRGHHIFCVAYLRARERWPGILPQCSLAEHLARAISEWSIFLSGSNETLEAISKKKLPPCGCCASMANGALDARSPCCRPQPHVTRWEWGPLPPLPPLQHHCRNYRCAESHQGHRAS